MIDTSAQAAHYEILAFGDSLTQGLKRDASGVIWAFPNPVYGARTGGYEPRLESLFSSQSGHTAFVYNWGVGGETSSGGVNRINSVLYSRFADYLLLLEGANDIYAGISAGTTQFNLGIMIDRCRAKNVGPILGTVTPNTTHPNGYLIPASMNPQIVTLANQKGVPLANLYNALASNWGYYKLPEMGCIGAMPGIKKLRKHGLPLFNPFCHRQHRSMFRRVSLNTRDRIRVSWGAVSGATRYEVYRCGSASVDSCSK